MTLMGTRVHNSTDLDNDQLGRKNTQTVAVIFLNPL